MLVKHKKTLQVLVLGLVLNLGATGIKVDGSLQGAAVEKGNVLSGPAGALAMAFDGERYGKKVFKRFWARTAYA